LYKFKIEGDPKNRILKASKGTPQGSMISPWLFNLCINELAQRFEKEIKKQNSVGPLTNIYMWADDVVMLFPIEKIVKVMEIIELTRLSTGLTINKGKGKTEFMWVTKPGSRDSKMEEYNGIKFVNKYEYLGFKIYANFSPKKTIKAIQKKINWISGMSGTIKFLHLKAKSAIIKTIIRAMIMYHAPMVYQLATTCWKGKPQQKLMNLDSRIGKAIRMIIPTAVGRSNREIRLVLGMMSMEQVAQYRIAAIFAQWHSLQVKNGIIKQTMGMEDTVFQNLIKTRNDWMKKPQDDDEVIDFSKIIREDAEEFKKMRKGLINTLNEKVIDRWKNMEKKEIKEKLGKALGGGNTPYKTIEFTEEVWRILTNNPMGEHRVNNFGVKQRLSCKCGEGNDTAGYTKVTTMHLLRCNRWNDNNAKKIWSAANQKGLAFELMGCKRVGELDYYNSISVNTKIVEQREIDKAGIRPGSIGMDRNMRIIREQKLRERVYEYCLFDLDVLYRYWRSKLCENVEEIPERYIQDLRNRGPHEEGEESDSNEKESELKLYN